MLVTLLKINLLLTVFITPLLVPLSQFGFEEVKLVFFTTINFISGLLFIYLILSKQLTVRWSLVKTLASTFLAILLVSTFTGFDTKSSILGTHPYYQGFIVYFNLFIFMLMVASLPISLKWYSFSLTVSACLVSVLILKDWYLLNIAKVLVLNYAGKPIATFGQPNLAAGFILLSLPFLFLLKPTQNKLLKILWILILFIFSGAIIATNSRAAIFLLLVLSLFYLSFQVTKLKIIVSTQIILLLILFIYISYNFSTGLLYQEIKRPQTIEWLIYNSPEKRVFIWPAIWQAISKRPFLGYGLENIPKAFPTFQPHERRPSAFYKLKDLVIDRSHNYILDLLVYGGILGLTIWLWLIILLLRQTKSGVLMAGLIIYIVWIQLQIQSIVHLIYFYLLVGLIDQFDTT